MIWNTIPNEERLHLWKKLRDDIQELQLKDQLNEVAKFCSKIPYGARTLDYYDPTDWLTPWEILFHGSFCTSSISLLMFYTLILLKNPLKVELYLVEDDDGTAGMDATVLPGASGLKASKMPIRLAATFGVSGVAR